MNYKLLEALQVVAKGEDPFVGVETNDSDVLWAQPNRPFGRTKPIATGATLKHSKSGKKLRVEAFEGKKLVGFARLVIGDDFVEADDGDTDDINPDKVLWVHPDYRRLGLADKMYDYAEKITKKYIIPSESRSGDGDKFWEARLKRLPEDHPAHDWF